MSNPDTLPPSSTGTSPPRNGVPGPQEGRPTGSFRGSSAEQPRVTRFIELDEDTPCYLRYITLITRIYGILLISVTWAFTVKILEQHKDYFVGWYLLGTAIVVTFLELVWLINKCVCCAEDRGCCCCIWRGILWIDSWRKTIIYGLASIPCFIKTILLGGVITGILLIVAAILYLFKSFKYCRCTKKTHRQASYMEVSSPQVSLVQHEVTQPTDPEENGIRPEPSSPEPKPDGMPNDMNTSYQQYSEIEAEKK